MNDLFETLPFRPADILLPQNCDLGLWSVVACDQYTSQPEYWQRVEERVGRAPSSLRLILPESCLDGPSVETDIMEINNTMSRYLREERFALLPADHDLCRAHPAQRKAPQRTGGHGGPGAVRL